MDSPEPRTLDPKNEDIMHLIGCTYEKHANAILQILNEAIVNSTALYDYSPRSPESMIKWFEGKTASAYPVIGVVSDEGALLGFGSYGTFRAFPAYKYTIENSVYVHASHRGMGIGTIILKSLIECATTQNYHVMVAAIDKNNSKSISLHEKAGFTHAGTIAQAGFKFGRWLDLAFYQLILKTPAYPVDGYK
jgi:phosphinothricin acetyltransferase